MLQRARNTVQFVNNGTVPHPARRLAALSSPVAISILPISYLIGERQLLFYRRLLCSDNIVLRTLARLVRFEMLGIAADIKSIYFSTATVKNAVWSSFVNVVKF